MKKYYLLFIGLLFANQYIHSQVALSKNVDEAIMLHNEKTIMIDSKHQLINLSNTTGTPYLHKDFISGSVHLKSSNQNLGYQMRYNMYTDEMEVKDSDTGNIFSLQKSSNITSKINNDTFYFLEYKDKKGNLKKGYFHELSHGKASLLVKYDCRYSPEKIGKPPVFKVTKANFKTFKVYYSLEDGQLKLLSTNLKNFINSFPNKNNEIKTYIKKNKLNIKKERDLIRIYNYYNSLT